MCSVGQSQQLSPNIKPVDIFHNLGTNRRETTIVISYNLFLLITYTNPHILQSAYRPYKSTETALAKIPSDILTNLNNKMLHTSHYSISHPCSILLTTQYSNTSLHLWCYILIYTSTNVCRQI